MFIILVYTMDNGELSLKYTRGADTFQRASRITHSFRQRGYYVTVNRLETPLRG